MRIISKPSPKGGFARCFLASADGQEFALKSITRESIRKETHWRKIRKEIASHFTLRHPNIVALYSHFEDRDNIYMLLEHCPNGTLGECVISDPVIVRDLHHEAMKPLSPVLMFQPTTLTPRLGTTSSSRMQLSSSSSC